MIYKIVCIIILLVVAIFLATLRRNILEYFVRRLLGKILGRDITPVDLSSIPANARLWGWLIMILIIIICMLITFF